MKKSINQNSEVFIISIWGLLRVSIQWDHLWVKHIYKITKKVWWVMGVLYINEISLVHIINLYWRVVGVCIDVRLLLSHKSKSSESWTDLCINAVGSTVHHTAVVLSMVQNLCCCNSEMQVTYLYILYNKFKLCYSTVLYCA
jgi:hypothetical protein